MLRQQRKKYEFDTITNLRRYLILVNNENYSFVNISNININFKDSIIVFKRSDDIL